MALAADRVKLRNSGPQTHRKRLPDVFLALDFPDRHFQCPLLAGPLPGFDDFFNLRKDYSLRLNWCLLPKKKRATRHKGARSVGGVQWDNEVGSTNVPRRSMVSTAGLATPHFLRKKSYGRATRVESL